MKRTTAIDLDYSGTNFSKEEWPDYEYVLSNMSVEPIEALFDIRKDLKKPIFPTPVVAGHVRNRGSSSKHDILDGGRLSNATDVFVERENAKLFWALALNHPKISGLGIYQHSFYNGEKDKYTMFHIDSRPYAQVVMWVAARENSDQNFSYHTYMSDTEQFFHSLTQKGFFF